MTSPFISQMRELLAIRLDPKRESWEKQKAEHDMADLIRRVTRGERMPDFKVAQAGEREPGEDDA